MPKQKITKDMVVDAAFEMARELGIEKVTVKTLAEKLGCSVQPIYSYCQSMDGLFRDVYLKSEQFMGEYLAARIDQADFFRSTGCAYIQMAKEEPNVFRMFLMHQREGISSLDDIYQSETDPGMAGFIAKELHISVEKARTLHRNMMIYTIGIGTVLAMSSPGIPVEEITGQLELAYQAFLEQAINN